MPTANTTIIPQAGTDNKTIFDSIVKKEFYVLILLGNDQIAKDTQPLADNVATANPGGISRKILWIKDPNLLKATLEQLIEDGGYNYSLNECLALTLNIHDKVKDVILRNEHNIDEVRIYEAFINAGTI